MKFCKDRPKCGSKVELGASCNPGVVDCCPFSDEGGDPQAECLDPPYVPVPRTCGVKAGGTAQCLHCRQSLMSQEPRSHMVFVSPQAMFQEHLSSSRALDSPQSLSALLERACCLLALNSMTTSKHMRQVAALAVLQKALARPPFMAERILLSTAAMASHLPRWPQTPLYTTLACCFKAMRTTAVPRMTMLKSCWSARKTASITHSGYRHQTSPPATPRAHALQRAWSLAPVATPRHAALWLPREATPVLSATNPKRRIQEHVPLHQHQVRSLLVLHSIHTDNLTMKPLRYASMGNRPQSAVCLPARLQSERMALHRQWTKPWCL